MKKIGIPGWKLGENSFGVTLPYITYIAKFGIPVILTPDHPLQEDLDLLVLPGGLDVLPTGYGAKPHYHTGNPNVMLEHFDKEMLPQYLDIDMPILGICRGAQSLWARFGGEIDQHNYWHKQSTYPTEQIHELEYTEKYKKWSKALRKVNSRHHQAMTSKNNVPLGIEVIALARDGQEIHPEVVEIWRHTDKPIFCLQGHPEDMYVDGLTPFVIDRFLNKNFNLI